MLEDIEHGGIAAYISEVAIDAALIDTPPPNGTISSAGSFRIGNEAGGGDPIELSRLQAGSSASYLRLSSVYHAELGDLESISLVDRPTDNA